MMTDKNYRNIHSITGEDDNNEKEDKTPDIFMQKILKIRTILLSGEVNKPLAERVVR
jgi:ATP-dependent Clp protease, protease subunit